MNSQLDFVGGLPDAPQKPFRDLPPMRDSVAEEKAVLLLELGRLINTCPASVRNGSVQTVRTWRVERDKAAKVAGNKRSSRQEISSALNSLRKYG